MLGSYEGIILGLSGGKLIGAILGNLDLIIWDILMATALHLRAAPVAARAGYHAIGDFVIRRISVTAVTASARAVLTWLVVHAAVVGWMLGGFGCHATSKGVGLSCQLYYSISFLLWILL